MDPGVTVESAPLATGTAITTAPPRGTPAWARSPLTASNTAPVMG